MKTQQTLACRYSSRNLSSIQSIRVYEYAPRPNGIEKGRFHYFFKTLNWKNYKSQSHVTNCVNRNEGTRPRT